MTNHQSVMIPDEDHPDDQQCFWNNNNNVFLKFNLNNCLYIYNIMSIVETLRKNRSVLSESS